YERRHLPCVELLAALLLKAFRHAPGNGEVHVVAAEKDVLADGHAAEFKLAVMLRHRDQGKVRRPAADVHDQDKIANGHLIAPVRPGSLDPAVKGGLGFL